MARTPDTEKNTDIVHRHGTPKRDMAWTWDMGHEARTQDMGHGTGILDTEMASPTVYVVGMIFNFKNLVEMPELWLSLQDTNSVALHDMSGGITPAGSIRYRTLRGPKCSIF